MKSSSVRSKVARKRVPDATSNPSCPSDEKRCARIAISAYYKAEARGVEPGHELEGWLAAKAEEK